MVFIELSPFVTFRDEHWNDHEFRRFQAALMQSPKAGDVIRSGGRFAKTALARLRARQARWRTSYLLFSGHKRSDLLDLRLREERARRLNA